MSRIKKQRAKPEKSQNIEITSRQKIKKINLNKIHLVVKKIFYLLNKPKGRVSVLFCDNKFIIRLNKRFFKKSRPTDVIAFPLKDGIDAEYLGEIVISVEQAANVCGLYSKKWQEELTLYLIHGILHLLGYDDIKEKERSVMQCKQEEILSRLLRKNKSIIDNTGI